MTISSRFVVLAVTLYAACAVWATWPAVRHVDDHYLARPAAGHGQAAAGDHLQLGWAFWLVGHQLEQRESPLVDPYSFRPEAEAPPNLQGWLLGVPYWPLSSAFGDVWAYDLVVLLSFVLAGGLACWWLRALAVSRPAALVGGLVFCLMPYRVGQSTGHLLGLVSFLLPAMLLALERRRFVLAAACLAALPLSGQLHLALGAIPLALGYAWARLPRAMWWKSRRGRGGRGRGGTSRRAMGDRRLDRHGALVRAGRAVLGRARGLRHARCRIRRRGARLPRLADAAPRDRRARRGAAPSEGLPWFSGSQRSCRACSPSAGTCPGYETLWRAVPGLDSTRVPERFMPIACLAIAALVGSRVRARDNSLW